MSAFLGPIHHWLFNKIGLAESRAFAIADALAKDGVDIAPLTADYGDKLQGANLPDIVGSAPIHQFLTGLITKVQVFEAQVVESAGAEGRDSILAAAHAHGKQSGIDYSAIKGTPDTLDKVAAMVNDSQLEGMPCDPGAVFGKEGNQVIYTHTACNHMANWRYTGVSVADMCAINNAWVAGFIAGAAGDGPVYTLEKNLADGADSCCAAITIE
jgi:hypothetical protein